MLSSRRHDARTPHGPDGVGGLPSWAGTLLLLLATLAVVSCSLGRETAPERSSTPAPAAGPILLITLEGLRSDAVESLGGLPGLTPAIDALAGEADWWGSAVAASSSSAPALATLLSGLRPHDHTAWTSRSPLRAEIETLPEALRARGYRTHAYLSSDWLRRAPGFLQGFDRTEPLAIARAAERDLRQGSGEPTLWWVELALPAAPYRLFPALLPRLDALGGRVARSGLPERIGLAEVRRARSGSLPADELARWWALYCLNVARADQRVGQLLDALRASGSWDQATVVVASVRGEELGDYGSVGADGGLRRRLIEVPLLVKLPASGDGRLAPPEPGTPLAVGGLWATLVELAGGEPPPGVVPGWLEDSRASPTAGAWSERRRPDGRFQVSWVSAGEQVLLELDPNQEPSGSRVSRWLPDGSETPVEDPAEAIAAEAARRWRLDLGGRVLPPVPELERTRRPSALRRARDSG